MNRFAAFTITILLSPVVGALPVQSAPVPLVQVAQAIDEQQVWTTAQRYLDEAQSGRVVDRVTLGGAYGLIDWHGAGTSGTVLARWDEGQWGIAEIPVTGISSIERADIPRQQARSLWATHLGVVPANQPPVAQEFQGVLTQLQQTTDLVVFLPAWLPSRNGQTYIAGHIEETNYNLELYGCPDGSGACFLGTFRAQAEHELLNDLNRAEAVQLENGITGYYVAPQCGASCTPPVVFWEWNGIEYRVAYKVQGSDATAQRSNIVMLANATILAGGR